MEKIKIFSESQKEFKSLSESVSGRKKPGANLIHFNLSLIEIKEEKIAKFLMKRVLVSKLS